jgi:DNA repair protein RecO (recombination protein O)
MAVERDQAICVRVWDWSETSQTMVLFARGLGLVRALAKGAKRTNANFSGGVEPMTRGEILISTRPLQRSPNALATLAGWDLLEAFPGARGNLDAFYAGSCLLDLVQHGLEDLDPHAEVFDALVDALRTLGDAPACRGALLRFAWTMLAATGHAPELDADVKTGEPLARANSYAFLPHRGGFAKDAGERAQPTAERDGALVWRVRSNTRELLRSLAAGRSDPSEDTSSQARAARLLLMYFREVHRCDPPAVRVALESRVLSA